MAMKSGSRVSRLWADLYKAVRTLPAKSEPRSGERGFFVWRFLRARHHLDATQSHTTRLNGPPSASPACLRIEIRVSGHANERRFRFGRRADAPIGFLVDVEPDQTFDEWEAGAEGGNDFIDPLAFVSAHLSRGRLANHDRLFPGCKQRVDFPENLLKGLPATVFRTPVVAIDPGPIDVGIAWVVVHRIFVTSVDIRDVWAPRPDHVGSARGHEDVVNMPISGNVQGRII